MYFILSSCAFLSLGCMQHDLLNTLMQLFDKLETVSYKRWALFFKDTDSFVLDCEGILSHQESWCWEARMRWFIMFLLQIPCMASLLGEAFSSTSKMTQSFQCTISPQKTQKKKKNLYIFGIHFRNYMVRNDNMELMFLITHIVWNMTNPTISQIIFSKSTKARHSAESWKDGEVRGVCSNFEEDSWEWDYTHAKHTGSEKESTLFHTI